MICDRIIYGGQTLLTIFHRGFDDEVNERCLKKVEKVGSYNLIFTETQVQDDVIDNIVGWSIKEEGLLSPGSIINPYSEAACAYMIHFQYAAKPSRLFKFFGDRYFLNISVDKLIHINEFIKKYTGLNIEKNPMLYGDIFVFKSSVFSYHANKSEGITVENLSVGTTIIVRFKKNDVIVTTKVIRINHDTERMEIKSDKPWTYHVQI